MHFLAYKKHISTFFISFHYLAFLFLISGISALIYQIVWQRALFTVFGVDMESVTIIVSIFMFGLGVGALIGGYLQRRFPSSLLRLFFIFEIIIGLYGLTSIYLISLSGSVLVSGSMLSLCIYVFAVLAIPTLLMGATLPILVSYLNGFYHNIGKSLALLYAFNTLGAAIAALLTVNLLFVFFGQKTTLLVAALCNVLTAYLIYGFGVRIKNQPVSPAVISENNQGPTYFSYSFVLMVAGVIGYIALSQEIVWYRTIGFMTASKPEVFGYILGAFLIGIAASSYRVKKICETGDPYNYLIQLLVLSAVVYYVAFPLISYCSALLGKQYYGINLAYLAVEVVAFVTGGVFPVLAYIGVKNTKNSASDISLIYFCNIVGAILGPLVTGFVLLEYFSLKANILIITVVSMVLAAMVIIIASPNKAKFLSGLALFGVFVIFSHHLLYANFLEHLQFGELSRGKTFKTVIENRSGIITVEAFDKGDIVYGGGIYDGKVNTDPVNNSNIIMRAYMIAAMHPKPERILQIGLSSGSWAKVLTSYQPVKELITVEINKGYVDLISHYPHHNTIMTDKKAKFYFDDGRRWLKKNPDEKFDMIIMNTSYHWRSNITNLLSREFLALCKRHLTKNGIIYYNTTGSYDVLYTAAHVFPYVTSYMNFVAASDAPFTLSEAQKKANLVQFLDDRNQPIFKADDAGYQKRFMEIVQYKFHNLKDGILKRKDLWLITDDNMATEYKVN